MPALLVLTAAAAWLLVGAGSMKLYRPDGTSHAIAVLTGTGENPLMARMLGAGEVGIAVAFIVFPNVWTSLLLAIAYVGVLASAWILRDRDEDCGCFGSASTRVGTAHLVVTIVAAAAASSLAIVGGAEAGFTTNMLIIASSPVALATYAVIAPLNQLRSRLADLTS